MFSLRRHRGRACAAAGTPLRRRSRSAPQWKWGRFPFLLPFLSPCPSTFLCPAASMVSRSALSAKRCVQPSQPSSFYEPLDAAILQKSLAEIARRHEVLRTTFDAIDGQGVQIIASPSSPALTVIDLRHQPEGEAQADNGANDETKQYAESTGQPIRQSMKQQTEIIKADASTPFDLARGRSFGRRCYASVIQIKSWC